MWRMLWCLCGLENRAGKARKTFLQDGLRFKLQTGEWVSQGLGGALLEPLINTEAHAVLISNSG